MTAPKKAGMRPGNIVPVSGIYAQYKNGNKINEVTSVKNEPFPPARTSGVTHRLIRKTK